MNQKEIVKKLKESAKIYKENLQNTNLLIIYNKNKKIEYIEILFLARNFMHLTGVRSLESSGKYKKANQFYNACLNNKLSYKNIVIKEDGTTELKLDIISDLVNIDKKCKIIGTYDNSKKELITDILVGSVHMCVGLIKDSKTYYIPNTLLKEDIRKLTLKQYPIICILKKKINEEKYQMVTCISKKIDIDKVEKNIELCNKINIKILDKVVNLK